MKFKILLLCGLFLCATVLVHGETVKKHYKDGRAYPEKDILDKSLSMSECQSYGWTKEQCIDIFIKYAMDKSAKSGKIEEVIWVE